MAAETRRQEEDASKSNLYGPPRLTFPTEADAESDLLPFALDRESSISSPLHNALQHDNADMQALSEMDLDMSGKES